jgi:hypothetical protein
MKNGKRVIVCAAVKIDDMIFCGVRHWDKLMKETIENAYDLSKVDKSRMTQGFIDNRYNFLTREEAWKVAQKTGQIPNFMKGNYFLFSKHLY